MEKQKTAFFFLTKHGSGCPCVHGGVDTRLALPPTLPCTPDPTEPFEALKVESQPRLREAEWGQQWPQMGRRAPHDWGGPRPPVEAGGWGGNPRSSGGGGGRGR